MIIVIKGPPKSGKTKVAVALRNSAISNGCGALLLDDFDPHKDPEKQASAKALAEKLVVGQALPSTQAEVLALRAVAKDDATILRGIDAIAWKKDPTVIVIGERGMNKLKEIEALIPGFIKKFGPVTEMSTAAKELILDNSK